MSNHTESSKTPPDYIQLIEHLYIQNKFEEVLKSTNDAISKNFTNTDLLDMAAASATALGKMDQAEHYWRQSLAINQNNGLVHFHLANLYNRLGKIELTDLHFREAIRCSPHHFEIYNNYANFLNATAHYREAESFYRRALKIAPPLPELHTNFGTFLKAQNRLQEADIHYQAALKLRPNHIDTLMCLGSICLEQKRTRDAETYYQKVITLNPNLLQPYLQLGKIYFDLKKKEDALKLYQTALSLSPTNAEAHFNLGRIYDHQDNLELAKTHYLKAIELGTNEVGAYNNLGLLYIQSKQWSLAEEYLCKAISFKANHSKICFNLGLLLLLHERFEEGWYFYETRHDPKMEDRLIPDRDLPFPQWQGESLKGKSLFMVCEQGFGDVIQFARYIPLLKKQGVKHITLECPTELKTLCQHLKGIDEVYASSEEFIIKPHDFWAFIVSIPRIFTTSVKTIPSETGYFEIPASTNDKWASRMPKNSFKVGLCWKGSLNKINDQRSLPHLKILRSLWSIPGISFISLQKGHGENEVTPPPSDQPLVHLGSEINDFLDTAKIIQQLDLLITVDTAIAHLGGAFGKPVWVMLPYVADWRWLLDRSDSPWYPHSRLFRQQHRGQWRSVIDLITSELRKVVTSRSKS